jgi:hypothetical protein
MASSVRDEKLPATFLNSIAVREALDEAQSPSQGAGN